MSPHTNSHGASHLKFKPPPSPPPYNYHSSLLFCKVLIHFCKLNHPERPWARKKSRKKSSNFRDFRFLILCTISDLSKRLVTYKKCTKFKSEIFHEPDLFLNGASSDLLKHRPLTSCRKKNCPNNEDPPSCAHKHTLPPISLTNILSCGLTFGENFHHIL